MPAVVLETVFPVSVASLMASTQSQLSALIFSHRFVSALFVPAGHPEWLLSGSGVRIKSAFAIASDCQC